MTKWQMLGKENQNRGSLNIKKKKNYKRKKRKVPEHLPETLKIPIWLMCEFLRGSLFYSTQNAICTDDARENMLHPACEFLGKSLNL